MPEIPCPRSRTKDLVIQSMPNETLVYDLVEHKAHCLNETSSFIWNRCDGDLTLEEIRQSTENAFGRRVSIEFIELALSQLHERNLLEKCDGESFSVMDRRKVIKKIGMAAAIALPVVASLTAPPNAFSVAANCVCTSNVSCVNRPCPSTTNCNNLGLCAPG